MVKLENRGTSRRRRGARSTGRIVGIEASTGVLVPLRASSAGERHSVRVYWYRSRLSKGICYLHCFSFAPSSKRRPRGPTSLLHCSKVSARLVNRSLFPRFFSRFLRSSRALPRQRIFHRRSPLRESRIERFPVRAKGLQRAARVSSEAIPATSPRGQESTIQRDVRLC